MSFALVACGGRQIAIHPVDPSGQTLEEAQVFVDGRPLGRGRVTSDVGERQQIVASVENFPEYFPKQVALQPEQISTDEVYITLQRDPAFSETRAPSELAVDSNVFLHFSIAEDFVQDNFWWRAVLDALRDAHFTPDQVESRSGFIRTLWKERRYQVPSVGEVQVRSRFLGSVVNTQPLRYRVKLEVQRKEPQQPQFFPWDRVYPDDARFVQQVMALTSIGAYERIAKRDPVASPVERNVHR